MHTQNNVWQVFRHPVAQSSWHIKLKKIITIIRSSLNGFISKVEGTKESISKIKYTTIKIKFIWKTEYWLAPLRPKKPVFNHPLDWGNSQWQRCQWFKGWGSLYVWSKVLGQHPTMCAGWLAGHGSHLCLGGRGPQGEIVPSWLISYQGNHQRDPVPTTPLISGVEFWPKARTVISWGLGQICKSVVWVGCRCISTGQAGDKQRTREQPSWGAWPYTDAIEKNAKSLRSFRNITKDLIFTSLESGKKKRMGQKKYSK